MKHATPIVLGVLLVALAAFLWWDRDKVTDGEHAQRANSAFVAWRRDELTKVEIAHDDETIELVKDGEWKLGGGRADQAAVDRLLATLEFATRVRKVDDGPELGFVHPRARGALTMGGAVFRFVLGAPSPRPEGSSYFRVDDGAPFVVSKEVTDALLARGDTLRDRTVVPYLATELARFEVVGKYVLERKDERSFTVGGLLAGRDAVEKLWHALAEIRAEAFPRGSPGTAHLVVKLTPKSGAPAELRFGDACPGHPDDVLVERTSPPLLACAPRGAVDLLASPGELVDAKPFSFHHDEIEELRLEGSGAIELARRGSGFHLRAPEDRELTKDEADAVSELLVRIERSTADEVRKDGPFTAVTKARVTAGGIDEAIEVGAIEGGHAIVRRLRDDARLVVSAAVARRLVPRATMLRPRAITPMPSPKRVRLRCGTAQDFVDDGAGLRLVTPAGYETDGAVTQLVDTFVKGSALVWVADRDDGTFGLDGRCTVALDGVSVRLGAGAEGGVYGAIEGQPGVFVAPLAARTLAERIFVSTAAFHVPLGAAVTVNGTPATAPEIVADRVVALGRADVARDLVIEATTEAGTLRIACEAAKADTQRCTMAGVNAVFQVQASRLAPLHRR